MGLSEMFLKMENKKKLKKLGPMTDVVLGLAEKYSEMNDETLRTQIEVL